ncbi:hypothetical protein BO70DRAFT_395399 [Aspergillus heteromorphus CBS 117.55]|uniref:Uncharacterized protein n=1 Tax=Aspergillus heteromorphus CBS 117.55 TaxID=1448321 RepID=A0A317WML7_9EURO|nr:uncharacterized protein BO70DRAFT_395399 [Aspergillus heteromorphus CBS 117.55]PWY86297.1 hypothetical protein BO70DRAFT_395399 [Aspergillus heteromorphus CBS 117.55]
MTFATAINNEGQSSITSRHGLSAEKHAEDSTDVPAKAAIVNDGEEAIGDDSKILAFDHTHRKLKPRHIQLIGIGGTIGTVLLQGAERRLFQSSLMAQRNHMDYDYPWL